MTSFSTRLMAAILLGAAERIEAATLCVNPGGTGGCFASIQAAVDAADSDDVVDIAAGTYVENVLVPAAGRFTLQGAGAGVTIVDGSAGPTSATLGKLADSDLSISALSLRNGSAGLSALGGRVEVTAAEISDNNVGIDMEGGQLTVTGTTIAANAWKGLRTHQTRVLIAGSTIEQNASGGVDGYRSQVTIESSVIQNNDAPGPLDHSGAGIHLSFGRLIVIDSTIAGNTASYQGGGIYTYRARAAITGSTIASNTAGGGGGGVWVGGTLKCINSTVTGNQGFGVGGMGAARLLLRSSTVTANVATMVGTGGVLAATAMNSIIADNVGPKNDCQELVSRGYNLVEDTSGCAIRGTTIGNVTGVDPLLGPLADNGGPTPTRALLPGSAAIDAANPNPNRCTITDQRGVARSGRCDIGAYEAP